MKKLLITLATIYCTTSINAAEVTAWKILPNQSEIEFRATQNASSISGAFKNFNGKINFDKDQLAQSKVIIEIDTSSVVASTTDASGVIQRPEWLSTQAFPKAIFTADTFTTNDNKTFHANGNLTLKGKTVPTSLDFTFQEYNPAQAVATGKTTIKRSAFGVGDSDIKKANGVKDDIEITFTVSATRYFAAAK